MRSADLIDRCVMAGPLEAPGGHHAGHRARAQVSWDNYRPATQVSQELHFPTPHVELHQLDLISLLSGARLCPALSQPY